MERYSRQTLFKPIGSEGQNNLSHSHILFIGAGALGTSSSEMLVRAGVGQISIIDRDYVEYSNLQRQQLFTEEDAAQGRPKAIAAAERLQQINSQVTITPYIMDVMDFADKSSCDAFDLIIDATDNFEARLYINDLAQSYDIPWIYGGIVGSYGMTYTIIPGQTPCFSCILKTLPQSGENCDTVGVIAPIVQWVTAHQVTEAMKILTENQAALRQTLLFFDIWTQQHTNINIQSMKNDNCPSCGQTPTYPYLQDTNKKTTTLCGRDTIQIRPEVGQKVNRDLIYQRFKSYSEKITANDMLTHVTLPNEKRLVIFHDGRVLLHGMSSVAEAQSIYDRYIRR